MCIFVRSMIVCTCVCVLVCALFLFYLYLSIILLGCIVFFFAKLLSNVCIVVCYFYFVFRIRVFFIFIYVYFIKRVVCCDTAVYFLCTHTYDIYLYSVHKCSVKLLFSFCL